MSPTRKRELTMQQHSCVQSAIDALEPTEPGRGAKPAPSAGPIRCKKCGEDGYKGGYPFSTYPAALRLCDDCG